MRAQPALGAAPVAEPGERVLQRVPAQQRGLPLGLPQPAAAHEHLRPHLPAAGVRAAGVGAVGLQPVQRLGGAAEVGGVLARARAGSAGSGAGRRRRRTPRRRRRAARSPPRRSPSSSSRWARRTSRRASARPVYARSQRLPSASTRRRTRRSGPSAPSRSSAQVRAHAWTTSSRSASAGPPAPRPARGPTRAPAIASTASSRDRSSVAAAAQGLGQLGVLLGRQQPHPPLVGGLAQGRGDVLAAHRVGDGRAPRGRGRRGSARASGAPGAVPGTGSSAAVPSVSRLASTARSMAASKWSAATSTWAR